jgi:pyrroline-5-carboxylate reductase
MNLGFIGTGTIASSVITGIFKSKILFNKIYISKRNKKNSQKLKRKYNKIFISDTNQEILDKCDWIFLSVTPTVGNKIIKELKFKSNQTIISFISTMNLSQLKKAIKVKAKIVRAIPLPPIALKKGPVPIYPPNKKVKSFLEFTTASSDNAKNKEVMYFCALFLLTPFLTNHSVILLKS